VQNSGATCINVTFQPLTNTAGWMLDNDMSFSASKEPINVALGLRQQSVYLSIITSLIRVTFPCMLQYVVHQYHGCRLGAPSQSGQVMALTYHFVNPPLGIQQPKTPHYDCAAA
jgi:hypothetical protein